MKQHTNATEHNTSQKNGVFQAVKTKTNESEREKEKELCEIKRMMMRFKKRISMR